MPVFHGIFYDYKTQKHPHPHPHPEIFNTDQGSQYTSEIHTKRLKDLGITISMDGKGRATDNICIERFWRSAKCERIYLVS
jgi:putative transposase